MKRLNPKNGELFKRGDNRPSTDNQDGLLFLKYRHDYIKKNGYFGETWTTQEGIKSHNKKHNINRKKNKIKNKFDPKKHKKRINPETGKYFSRGDIENGKYFISYDYVVSSSTGYCREKWGIRETYIKICISRTHTRIKKACNDLDIPYDIDTEYLTSIYPKDSKCPALGISMWFSDADGVYPSVDRIDPKKGYIKGNVIWVSYKANRIKNDATVEELKKVTRFYSKLLK